jgi:hypothetical protein
MDIIDQANNTAEQMLEAHRSMRKRNKLIPVGCCHYCNELLPKVGQLFCDGLCLKDYEYEDRRRKASGTIE